MPPAPVCESLTALIFFSWSPLQIIPSPKSLNPSKCRKRLSPWTTSNASTPAVKRREDVGHDPHQRSGDQSVECSHQHDEVEPFRQPDDLLALDIQRYHREHRECRFDRAYCSRPSASSRSEYILDMTAPISAPTISSRNGPSSARMPGFLRS